MPRQYPYKVQNSSPLPTPRPAKNYLEESFYSSYKKITNRLGLIPGTLCKWHKQTAGITLN